MICPVCKTHGQYLEVDLHSAGFAEDICTCSICGSIWSINHGMTEVVKDTQEKSFLSAITESVEADDYCYAA